MDMRKEDKDFLTYLYTTHMQKDFPANEIKPLPTLLALMDKNRYIAYGFYENEELCGYALFTTTSDQCNILLDYFAVCANKRSNGYGSVFLQTMKEQLQGEYHYIIGEVEAIDYAEDPEDAGIRYRRIRFYERNGLRHTGLMSRLLNGHFVILVIDLQEVPEDDAVAKALADVYTAYFGQEFVRDEVIIEQAPHRTIFQGVDYAQLAR